MTDPFAYDPSAPAPAQPTAPAPLVAPDQSFMSTVRVGIDINGNIWQLQGAAGVVKVGTGAVPQASAPTGE